MFRGLQKRIARIARLADEAYNKLHDRCHVRELLEKSRRFEFWWKMISSLRCVLIHIVRFDCDTRTKHLDHFHEKLISFIDELASQLFLNHEIYCSNISIIFDEITYRLSLRISRQTSRLSLLMSFCSDLIRTDYIHEEQTTLTYIRTSFEQSTVNVLRSYHQTTFSLEKQHERRLRTTITVHTLLHSFSFLSVNDHTASSLRIILERTFHRTRVLFFREFFLVYYSFSAWVVLQTMSYRNKNLFIYSFIVTA
jgi:hypothetical protein